MAGTLQHQPHTSLDGASVADYVALMEREDNKCEYISGEIIVSPSPNFQHGRTEALLISILQTIATQRGDACVGNMALRLDAETYLVPDLMYVERSHPDFNTSKWFLLSPPLLAVEILSPSNARHDRFTKFALYERAGVPNYWIADPVAKTLTAFQLVSGSYREVVQPSPGLFSASPFGELTLRLADVYPV